MELREAVAASPEATAVAKAILDYVVGRLEADPAGAETLAAELKANASGIAAAAAAPKEPHPLKGPAPPAVPPAAATPQSRPTRHSPTNTGPKPRSR